MRKIVFCLVAALCLISIRVHAEEIYNFQNMVKLLQDASFIKKADLMQMHLIKPDAIKAGKNVYELDDSEMHAFYYDAKHPKIDVKEKDVKRIRAIDSQYLKKHSKQFEIMAPADLYYVAYNKHNKPLFLISRFPGDILSVREIISFWPDVCQNHPGSKIDFQLTVTELFAETLLGDNKSKQN